MPERLYRDRATSAQRSVAEPVEPIVTAGRFISGIFLKGQPPAPA